MTDRIDVDEADLGEGTVVLAPDASILAAIGRGHTLASALADLIDNSFDAGATRVSIRFVTQNAVVRSIRIRDDGCGMTIAQLQHAMTLGGGSEHSGSDQGHFRVGLKAASLSQARILTVFSTTGFSPAAGMRLDRAQSGPQIRAQVIDAGAAASVLQKRGLDADSGTVVEWSGLESVSEASTYHARRNWFEAMIVQLRDELGLTFHRLIADERIRIEIDELDESSNDSGAPRVVKPIDPFEFERWGSTGYPRALDAELAGGGRLTLTCYILPPAVEGPHVKMLGRPRVAWQGLFVYRNDRLLHTGGWLQLHPDGGVDTQLARAVIELTSDVLDAVAMNAEKRGVVLRPSAMQALEHARTDGFSLKAYFDDAREVWRRGQQRELRAQPFAAVGEGAPSGLESLVEKTLGVRDDAPAISFGWVELAPRQLYSFEPLTGLVWLNSQHRVELEADPPRLELLKTSIFLLLEAHAGKERLAGHTRQRLDVVHAALASVAIRGHVEDVSRESGRGPREVTAQDLPDDDPDRGRAGDDDELVLVESIFISGRDPYEPLADPALADVHIDDDVLKDLLRRAKDFPLLSAHEEVELAHEIEVGVFAAERIAWLAHEDRVTANGLDLQWLARNGERAIDRMVGSNLRLVLHIAKGYQNRGLELADLVQEGITGLLRAVQKFDRFHGTKFSTYSTWWIRQAITRALADQGRTIRFPVHIAEKLPDLIKAWKDTSGISAQRINDVAEALDEAPASVRAVINNLDAPYSLDWPVLIEAADGETEWVSLADELVDANDLTQEEHFERAMLPLQVKSLLDTLGDREANVIRLRFGIDGDAPRTLDAVGESIGVTRERARQIEAKTLDALRDSELAKSLRAYL
ncbi:sigma-70 family RNA polymerase sigma factor [Microbacterium trichothecenolyticum]|uniref:sigma-70 family RNA polymerase sigma factor n=1 Tax=Microbacterium trichothecenolyticum TaxID=69370 RepID=UPI0035BE6A76